MAGAPVRAPISAATPSIAVPTTVPATIAVTAAASDSSLPLAPSTVAAVVKPISETPRFIQSAKWSRKRRVRGGSVSSTSGASTRAGGSRTAVAEDGDDEDVEAGGMADISLRRHYPDRFRRSAPPRRSVHGSRGVRSTGALSAWWVQAPACQFGATG